MIRHNTAVFSLDRAHRYTLWRNWAEDQSCPFVQFIGLNPSTADETLNDPTVRRCINYAMAWGYGAMCMTNLFALRATDPRVMIASNDPKGQFADEWLETISASAALVVPCWGVHGSHLGRSSYVRRVTLERARLAGKVSVLKLTKGGEPSHPLYLRSDLRPFAWKS